MSSKLYSGWNNKIPNSKHQIPNKFQIPIFNVQNVWSAGGGLVIGICLKFVILDLLFPIF